MAAGSQWASLPSILVVEILSYLSLKDRIRSSSICKRWRFCLFHPLLWNRMVYDLSFYCRQRSRFLSSRCGRFVKQTEIVFNSHNITEVRECLRVLDVVASNKNTQCFTLRPSGCQIEWPDSEAVHIIDRYLDRIETLIRTSRHLKHFALGCVEELLEHSNFLISILSRYHANCLESLHLASVKEDSESYGIIELNADCFKEFLTLRCLSIDYDYLTNELLQSFIEPNKTKLEKLVIHIHGIDTDHEKITNETWRKLHSHSPKLEVTLNLIHSFEGVIGLLDILQPSMPLAQLRQLFCSHVNLAAINFISSHYGSSMKSVHIIDGFTYGAPNLYESETEEDPFVMMAWRCPKLENFTLIGYQVSEDDIIAIARLRGQQLKTFNIPMGCIVSADDEDEDEIMPGYLEPDFSQKVSESLQQEWEPVEDDCLPAAVLDAEADAELAYMHILLNDQSWTESSQD